MNLLIILFNTNRKNNTLLILFSIYCLTLLVVRAKLTQSIFLFFLIWNLFLAIIPYMMIVTLKSSVSILKSKFKTGAYLFVWLLFLPNSFYIITDFVHLSQSNNNTFWFDLIVLSSYAFMGFTLGLLSLSEFEKIVKPSFSSKIIRIIIPVVCFLCGIGIYIGRILRYNSWDIISNPFDLVNDILSKLVSIDAFLFSLHFGFFIYLFYVAKNLIINTKSS
jgi:uncharacterized membrane protein